MAAATVDKAASTVSMAPYEITKVQLSAMTSGQIETVTHGGNSGTEPVRISMTVLTRPACGSPVQMEHVVASDTATACGLRFYNAASDLTDCVVQIEFEFHQCGAGGYTYT